MKCGPDGCPIIAFSDLTPAEQRVQRKRYAANMAEQGFTEKHIAKQLGVDQATISRDLSNLCTVHKSKPTKTATNPKGAGRPKGKRSARPKITDPHKTKIIAAADAGVPSPTIAADLGINARVVHRVVQDEHLRREGQAEPDIERTVLSMSAQEKLDAAIRQHKRKLDLEFEIRCREECQRWLNEVSLPQYAKELGRLEHLIRNREGVMDRITYQKIRACLHPDRVQDPALKKRYEEAFRLFTELEKRVLNEKESPTTFRTMPRTYADLMAMKAKVQATRKAKRHANPIGQR